MGGKSDMATRQDPPETGGADRDNSRNDAGVLERETQELAQDMAEKRASMPEHALNKEHAPFSVGNEPNNARNAE